MENFKIYLVNVLQVFYFLLIKIVISVVSCCWCCCIDTFFTYFFSVLVKQEGEAGCGFIRKSPTVVPPASPSLITFTRRVKAK